MSTVDGWDEEPEDSVPVEEGPNTSVDVAVKDATDGEVVPFEPSGLLDLNASAPLSYDEAVIITEHIRSTADVLYVLIQRAHAGKAWEPLGYSSFADYVKEEFNISRSRAYQLLNQAKVVAEITAAAPEGTKVTISEAAARDLKSLISEIAPDIAERTKDMSTEDAGDMIEKMLEEYRNRPQNDEEDGGDDEFVPHGDYQGEYQGGNKTDDNDLEEEEDLDALLRFDNDPRETRLQFESVYALYLSLGHLKDMPPVDTVISWIPDERRVQISSALPSALKWVKDFSESWNKQPWAIEGQEVAEGIEEVEEEDFDPSDESDIFS